MPRFFSVAVAVFVACGVVTTIGLTARGQSRAEDEQAIRAIVAKMNAGEPPVDLKTFRPQGDEIFWSGAMVKPQIGSEKPQFRPGSSGAGGRVEASSHTQIVQLHVSSGGDMAYEYSTFKNAWIRKDDKRKVEFEGASLRTWRKLNGQWTVAAQFMFPYDNTPTER